MKRISMLAALLASSCSPAFAQGVPQNRIQESFRTISANVPTSTFIVYGGTYIFSQGCTAYGTVTLQVTGPLGTQITLATKAAADTTGGTSITLAAGANVSSTAASTTGCIADLTRVPN